MSSDPDFAAIERHREAVTEQLGDERTAEEREEDEELIDRDVKEAQNRGL